METTKNAPGVNWDVVKHKVDFRFYRVVDHVPYEDFNFRWELEVPDLVLSRVNEVGGVSVSRVNKIRERGEVIPVARFDRVGSFLLKFTVPASWRIVIANWGAYNDFDFIEEK